MSTHVNSSDMLEKYFDRFLILCALLAFTLFQMTSTPVLAAGAHSSASQVPLTGYCNNREPFNNHCYAQITWTGHSGGTTTLINPYGDLNCSGCAGFIDNETWFSDPNSSQCTSDQDGECWVESGISTYPASDPINCHKGYNSVRLFWADERPGAGGYNEHPLYTFGGYGVNLLPYMIYVYITNHNSWSSQGTTWDVATDVYESGNLVAQPGGQSTNNQMNVDQIQIGSELSDTNGSAGDFHFQYNKWLSTNGNFNYQQNAGQNTSTNPPPHGFWNTVPCNCQGNTGGDWVTYD